MDQLKAPLPRNKTRTTGRNETRTTGRNKTRATGRGKTTRRRDMVDACLKRNTRFVILALLSYLYLLAAAIWLHFTFQQHRVV